jgi:hypothetical protein
MSTKILNGVYTTAYNLTSPVTTLSITAAGYLADGITATGLGSYRIINNGGILAADGAISLAGGGTVLNTGSIISQSTTAGAGVLLSGGGAVINGGTSATGALIEGYYGVATLGAATIANDGTIMATGKYAVSLAAGGVVTNGGAGADQALIEGQDGVVSKVAATLTNSGVILATYGAGVYFGGGVVNNGGATDTTATIEAVEVGVDFKSAAGTVTNGGSIIGLGTSGIGVAMLAGGSVINGSTADTHALISGVVAVGIVGGTGTVANYGTITSDATTISSTTAGVYMSTGGTVTNGSSKVTSALISGPYGVSIGGAAGTVSNFGTIGGLTAEIGVALLAGGSFTNGAISDKTALVRAATGVGTAGAPATIQNYGTIISGGTTVLNSGVYMQSGGVVTNGSTTDTTAFIRGLVGVYSKNAAATVTNFGTLTGSFGGVILAAGGKVTNGSTQDTTALMQGKYGAIIANAAGTVINFGTIRGAVVGGVGAGITGGGVLTNGSTTDTKALIQGAVGVYVQGAGKATNFGTISGNAGATSIGVTLSGGGILTNGATGDTTALITGYAGALIGAGATLANLGTIRGTDGVAVALTDATARLNAEAGSVFLGGIDDEAGLVDFVSGGFTVAGLLGAGKIAGAGTVTLNGGHSTFETGLALTVPEIIVAGAATVVEVSSANLGFAGLWDQTAGTLTVDTGGRINFTDTGDTFAGTLAGAGLIDLAGGSDTLASTTISATDLVINTAKVTLSGTIGLSGTLNATTANLIVAAGGATLTGGGRLNLGASTDRLYGATAAATLTNVNDQILGGGALGNGVLTLVNQAGGLIDGKASTALVINTGANTIVNAGKIEANGAGGVVVSSAINNTGTLYVDGSVLTLNGAVTGAGKGVINGGTLFAAGAFSENVTFAGVGVLELARSTAYAGSVTGLATGGTNSLDLNDIASDGTTTATYSGTTASGTLTVTDGTHTARIKLIGDYTASTFTLASDGHGGTTVTDPPAPAAKPHAFIAAMATMGAGAGGLATATAATSLAEPTRLARPG